MDGIKNHLSTFLFNVSRRGSPTLSITLKPPSHPSASWDVFGFVSSLETRFDGVKPLLAGSEQSPAGSFGYVVQSWEAPLTPALLVNPNQLLETLVIDPRPPLAIHLELKINTKGEKEWSGDLGATWDICGLQKDTFKDFVRHLNASWNK